MVVNSALFEKK
jgi:hypothetical protein